MSHAYIESYHFTWMARSQHITASSDYKTRMQPFLGSKNNTGDWSRGGFASLCDAVLYFRAIHGVHGFPVFQQWTGSRVHA
jgi:hypothetical protein